MFARARVCFSTIAASYASSYEWFKGTSEVGTGNTLTFNDVTSASNGIYTCTLTNAAGSVTSNAAVLRADHHAGDYLQSLVGERLCLANGYLLSFRDWHRHAELPVVHGRPPNGTAIAGATSSSYTTGSSTDTDNGTEYGTNRDRHGLHEYNPD